MSFHVNGKQVRRSTGTTDKRLAERIYAKLKTRVAEEEWLDIDEGKKRTFNELAERYESRVFKELKNWKPTESYLKQLKEFFGPYTLKRIDAPLLDDFKQMRRGQGVKPATINRQLNILKRMLNLAFKRWKWLKAAPYIEMEPRADKKRVRHLSFEDYHDFLDCYDSRLKEIVAVAAWTGLSKGNIIGLKRSQVSLTERSISIDGEETKNGEPLILPLAEPAYKVVVKAMKELRIASLYEFCKKDGTPYHKQHVHRVFREAVTRAGLEDFRFHDLRHCFASWNRQAGVDLDTLADLMGHKDTRMTRR